MPDASALTQPCTSTPHINTALHAAANCQFMCESIVLREMLLRARRRILVLLQVTDADDYAAPACGKESRRTHAHPPHQNINAVKYGDHERVVCGEGREGQQPLREQSKKHVQLQ